MYTVHGMKIDERPSPPNKAPRKKKATIKGFPSRIPIGAVMRHYSVYGWSIVRIAAKYGVTREWMSKLINREMRRRKEAHKGDDPSEQAQEGPSTNGSSVSHQEPKS